MYYPVAGATLAPGASAGVGIGGTLYYIIKDHLGSAGVVTDSTGTVVSGSEQRYCEAPLWGYPYGESRLTGTMLTDKLFTGQRDVGLGIYHYGARFRAAPLAKHTQRVRSEAEWGIRPNWESHGSALFI